MGDTRNLRFPHRGARPEITHLQGLTDEEFTLDCSVSVPLHGDPFSHRNPTPRKQITEAVFAQAAEAAVSQANHIKFRALRSEEDLHEEREITNTTGYLIDSCIDHSNTCESECSLSACISNKIRPPCGSFLALARLSGLSDHNELLESDFTPVPTTPKYDFNADITVNKILTSDTVGHPLSNWIRPLDIMDRAPAGIARSAIFHPLTAPAQSSRFQRNMFTNLFNGGIFGTCLKIIPRPPGIDYLDFGCGAKTSKRVEDPLRTYSNQSNIIRNVNLLYDINLIPSIGFGLRSITHAETTRFEGAVFSLNSLQFIPPSKCKKFEGVAVVPVPNMWKRGLTTQVPYLDGEVIKHRELSPLSRFSRDPFCGNIDSDIYASYIPSQAKSSGTMFGTMEYNRAFDASAYRLIENEANMVLYYFTYAETKISNLVKSHTAIPFDFDHNDFIRTKPDLLHDDVTEGMPARKHDGVSFFIRFFPEKDAKGLCRGRITQTRTSTAEYTCWDFEYTCEKDINNSRGMDEVHIAELVEYSKPARKAMIVKEIFYFGTTLTRCPNIIRSRLAFWNIKPFKMDGALVQITADEPFSYHFLGKFEGIVSETPGGSFYTKNTGFASFEATPRVALDALFKFTVHWGLEFETSLVSTIEQSGLVSTERFFISHNSTRGRELDANTVYTFTPRATQFGSPYMLNVSTVTRFSHAASKAALSATKALFSVGIFEGLEVKENLLQEPPEEMEQVTDTQKTRSDDIQKIEAIVVRQNIFRTCQTLGIQSLVDDSGNIYKTKLHCFTAHRELKVQRVHPKPTDKGFFCPNFRCFDAVFNFDRCLPLKSPNPVALDDQVLDGAGNRVSIISGGVYNNLTDAKSLDCVHKAAQARSHELIVQLKAVSVAPLSQMTMSMRNHKMSIIADVSNTEISNVVAEEFPEANNEDNFFAEDFLADYIKDM